MPPSQTHRPDPVPPLPRRPPHGRDPVRGPDAAPCPMRDEDARLGQPRGRLEVGSCNGNPRATGPSLSGDGPVRPILAAVRRTTALALATLPSARRCPNGGGPRAGRLGAIRPTGPSRARAPASPDPCSPLALARRRAEGGPVKRRRHAVEIILTRPATRSELHRACRAVPLAVNADRTRLMTVRTAKSSGRALRSLRRELHRPLPIDVLTTHYADQSGRVLLNLALPRATCSAIRKATTGQGQKPGEHLSRKVVAAVEREARERARRLNLQLERLLVHHAPEDLLTSAAHVFLGSRRLTSRHSSGGDIADTSP